MTSPKQAIRDVQHFGEEGGVVPVIDLASTSTFLNPDDMQKSFQGEKQGCYLYSRHSNPTVTMLGQKLAALENLPAGIGVGSGMAAISTTLLQLVKKGEHIVASRTVYGGTYAFLANILPNWGIEVTFVNPDDTEAFEKAIQPNTKVFYTETLSNPLLTVSDLSALGKMAKAKNIKLVVDNTFTPHIVTPADFGADVVIHSCTKFISGASDLIGGAIVSSTEFIQELIGLQDGMVMLLGPTLDSRVAHELYLRLDHLAIRMQAHSACAMDLAVAMEEKGIPTTYPGLKSHPQHEVIKKMINPDFGFGGIITMDCGTSDRARDLAIRLQDDGFGLYAVSLGFSRTLMSRPSTSTSSEIPEDEQKIMGMKPGLLRMSIGFTGDSSVMKERFFKAYEEVL